MDMLISLIMVNTSQCLRTSKHRIVQLTYTELLFVNYTSTKLGNEKRERKGDLLTIPFPIRSDCQIWNPFPPLSQ